MQPQSDHHPLLGKQRSALASNTASMNKAAFARYCTVGPCSGALHKLCHTLSLCICAKCAHRHTGPQAHHVHDVPSPDPAPAICRNGAQFHVQEAGHWQQAQPTEHKSQEAIPAQTATHHTQVPCSPRHKARPQTQQCLHNGNASAYTGISATSISFLKLTSCCAARHSISTAVNRRIITVQEASHRQQQTPPAPTYPELTPTGSWSSPRPGTAV
jgi:hypothetical protein